MIRFLRIFLLLVLSSSVFGQVDDIERLMTRRYLTCQDIQYNVQFLIPELYDRGSTDTISAILDYWENRCSISEELTRCKILFAIERGDFDESIYDGNIIHYLITYRNSIDTSGFEYGKMYNHYFWSHFYLESDTLNEFTVKLAKRLLKRDDLEPIEIFILRMYSNDFDNTFSMLAAEDFNGTIIQELYFKEIKSRKKQIVSHGDLLFGAWIPRDNLAVIGSHPYLGFRYGMRYKKLVADISMGFRFGRAPNVYQVSENDSIWDTDHFFGGYIGLDIGFQLFNIKENSIDLIGGIAFDGFDALKVDDPDSNTDIKKSLNSLNLNIGIGYKYFFNQYNYLGVDFKYNFVNYENPSGTDLSGNVITVNLIFGFYGNRYNDEKLKELDYFE